MFFFFFGGKLIKINTCIFMYIQGGKVVGELLGNWFCLVYAAKIKKIKVKEE